MRAAVEAWACANGHRAKRLGDRDEFVLTIGTELPPWFWFAVADGRIEVVGARYGDLTWGQAGVNFKTPDGHLHHCPLNATLRRADVAPPAEEHA